MTILALNLTLIEFIALPIVAVILGITIYFFLKTRRTLREAIRDDKTNFFSKTRKGEQASKNKIELEERYIKRSFESLIEKVEPVVKSKKISAADENLVQDMKNTISQQQKLLSTYLKKVEELEEEGREELRAENTMLQKDIARLYSVVEKKDEEMNELQQQAASANKMAAKIEEVYQEFDLLQSKMVALEKQANKANTLMMELEDTRQMYEQVHKELLRKQEKMEEMMNENHRMRQEIETLEDKLSEANLQRQQLNKKVQFLQDLSTDMQSLSDTNKKLQTELRRIGELESMLTMMSEERDYLLRRKMDK